MNDVVNETGGRRKHTAALISIILIVLIAVGAGAWYYFEKGPGKTATTETGETAVPDVVAKVNGIEISRDAYLRNLEQLKSAYTAQGYDVTDASSTKILEEQALNSLVNRKVFLLAAEAAKMTVEDSSLETEFKNTVDSAGGADAFNAALARTGLTEELIREDIREGLLIQQYLSTELKINEVQVSDEEVETYYNSVKATNPDVPALDDVKDALKAQLQATKQEASINAALEKLRTNVKIEILI